MIYRLLLCLNFFCIGIAPLFAQSAVEEERFNYTNHGKGKFETLLIKKNSHKYKVTHEILMNLIKAKGDKRMPIPTLRISNSERYVAYAKPKDAIICLEEKAYDICTSFGKDSLNAIAALLAHELTHYYEKHNWTSHFIQDHKDLPLSHKLKEFDEKIKQETQADYLGGFLAYTAGYPTLDILPNFLEKIYDGYRFPKKMKGYPSLHERQEIATNALKNLQNLILVFEIANWMTAIGEYELAKTYYDYILLKGQYQSREIYNNLGVMATLAALSYFTEEELDFVYPIELDPISRISTRKRGFENRKQVREELLKQAMQHFKVALTLDEEYPVALLNLGCVYTILDSYFDANYHAQKAVHIALKQEATKTMADAENLLGIIAARQEKEKEATTHFNKAIALDSPLALINKNLLKEVHPKPHPLDKSLPTLEKVEDIHLDQLVNQLYNGKVELQEEVQINKETIFGLKKYEHSKVLIHAVPFKEAHLFFHVTENDYKDTTKRSIVIGDNKTKLIEAYGKPQRTIESSNGQYLVYEKQRLIFNLQKEKINAWCTFRQQNSSIE